MKLCKYTLLCAAVSACLSLTGYAADLAEQATKTIRSRHAKINRELKSLKRVERVLEGYSTEGGSLVCYSFRSSPRKMVAHYLSATGKASEEYYFWNNRLFFLLRTESQYDKPFGRVVKTNRSRFYFDRGKLIRWIDARSKQVSPTTPDAQQRAGKVLQEKSLRTPEDCWRYSRISPTSMR